MGLLSGCAGASPEVEDGEVASLDGASEALQRSALTPAQAQTTLKLIDDICGDTWCEGDYDFGFRRLTCDKTKRTCTLLLQLFSRDGEGAARKSYFRSCKTPGFTGFSSLVATAPNGYQSLQSDYYDALSECISRIETKLR